MSDYITRDEFEAAIAALQCVGDQQTIDVTQSPGGQTIRSIQVIGDDADTAAGYVSVSYDSGTEKFTVTVTDLPCTRIDKLNNGTSSPAAYTFNETFIFDKPTTVANFYLIMVDNRETQFTPEVVWYDPTITGLTSTDGDTNEKKTISAIGNTFAYITINSDGSYSINSQTKNQVLFGRVPRSPKMYIQTSSKTILLDNLLDQFDPPNTNNLQLVYSEPFSKTMIIGWNYGLSDPVLDILDNYLDYDDYRTIGQVQISSSNNVERCDLYITSGLNVAQPFGWTGAFTNGDGNSILVSNGLIVNEV